MNKIARRNFLKLWQAILGLIGVMIASPTLIFWWLDKSKTPSDENWIDLGKLRKIVENEWSKYTVSIDINDRWKTRTIKEILYVYREGTDLSVLSSVCPHTGCLVKIGENGFICPCHKSVFDQHGSVVKGPSLRSLDSLKWNVKKGRLYVKYQQFRSGIEEKIAIS